jgi:lipoprotein-anchoring transpeptidase ErfK/SrfK
MPLKSAYLAGDVRLEQAAAGGPSIKPLPVHEPLETVRRIQIALRRLTYVFFHSFKGDEPDGLFGPDTKRTVVHFQRAVFIGQSAEWDGRLGKKTLAKLDAALLSYGASDVANIFEPLRGPAALAQYSVKEVILLSKSHPGPRPKPTPKAEVKSIKVDTDAQTVHAFLGDRLIYNFDCVPGDSDHPTDPGTHTIFRKQHPCVSTTYHVRMDYAQFFTKDGKALHQYHGLVPLAIVRLAKKGSDWFGSHGCVRLTEDDAKTLFSWTPNSGTKVTVVPMKK